MNRMVKEFQDTIPGAGRFMYWEKTNEWLALDHKPTHPKKAVEEFQVKLNAINEQWFYWQHAWNRGKEEPILVPEDIDQFTMEAILDSTYVEQDYDREVGPIEVQYQISNNFHNREFGRHVITKVFEAYKKIKRYTE